MIVISLTEGEKAVAAGYVDGAGVSRIEHFAATLDSISLSLGNIPILKDKWNEFRNSLFVPEGGRKDRVYGSLPAESFFSEDGFLHRHYSERLFSAVPNYLTGIGILGTFVGLAAGIQLAAGSQTDFSVNAPNTMMTEALKHLIGAAKLAFVTSVAGLSLSIVFSAVEKRVFGMALTGLSSFNALLDASIVLFSAEVLARKQLDLLQGLKEFPPGGGRPGLAVRTELGGSVVPFIAGFEASVEDLLAKNVERSVKPELDRIAGILEDIHLNRSLELSRAVKIMVDAFLESLHGATHAAIESVAGNLRLVAEECEPITLNLMEVNRIIAGNIVSGEAMAREVNKAASELSGVAASLSETAVIAERAVRGASASAADVSERFERISNGLDRTVTRTLDGQTAAVTLLNEELARLGASVATGMDDAGRMAERLFGIVEARIAETREAAAKAVEVAGGAAVAEIAKAGTGLESAVNSLATDLSGSARERIDGLGERLAGEIARIPPEAERISEALRSRIDEMADRLDGTLAAAGKGQHELHLAMLGQIDGCGKDLEKAISGIADAQTGVYSQVLAQLDLYNSRFAELLAAMSGGPEKLLRELDETVRRLYAELADMYVSTTEGFKTAAEAVNGQMTSFIADQRGVLEKHNESVERIWKGQETGVQALNTALDGVLGKFHDHISFLADSYDKHNAMYERHLERMNAGMERLESLWKSHASGFGDIDDALSKTLERLHGSYLANIRDAQNFLSELDAGFAKAVVALKETADEMNFTIRRLGEQREGERPQ
jgi:hypothetical protein